MAGSKISEEILRLGTPHTYNGLTKLVMAMAAVANSKGKRTLFGKDKGVEAYSKFLNALKGTLHSMVLDGVASESSPASEVAELLVDKLVLFERAHPNWQDAYGFALIFLGDERVNAIATIERLRSMP